MIEKSDLSIPQSKFFWQNIYFSWYQNPVFYYRSADPYKIYSLNMCFWWRQFRVCVRDTFCPSMFPNAAVLFINFRTILFIDIYSAFHVVCTNAWANAPRFLFSFEELIEFKIDEFAYDYLGWRLQRYYAVIRVSLVIVIFPRRFFALSICLPTRCFRLYYYWNVLCLARLLNDVVLRLLLIETTNIYLRVSSDFFSTFLESQDNKFHSLFPVLNFGNFSFLLESLSLLCNFTGWRLNLVFTNFVEAGQFLDFAKLLVVGNIMISTSLWERAAYREMCLKL